MHGLSVACRCDPEGKIPVGGWNPLKYLPLIKQDIREAYEEGLRDGKRNPNYPKGEGWSRTSAWSRSDARDNAEELLEKLREEIKGLKRTLKKQGKGRSRID